MSPNPGSLEHWASERPETTALVEDARSITWREWNGAADRVAAGLAAHGVVADDIVVLRTQIRIEWAILASALAKLGCRLLGLNWRLTPAETQYVLANSGARAFICDDADPALLLPALSGLPIQVRVSIDAQATGFTHFSQLLQFAPEPRCSRGDPPLIVYTSGTTGLPKGVVMGARSQHFTPEQVLEYQRDIRPANATPVDERVVLVTMPMHHGAGPAQMWGALRAGRKAVLLRRFDPQIALRLIAAHRITDWNAVPTMMKRIAGLPRDVLAQYDVGSIRHLSVGAAPVPFALKEWILGHFGEHVLSEGYGSTETGMITRLPPDMQRARPGSSGKPFRQVSIEIRDAAGRALRAGQVGELWVRTPTTLAQYLNGAALDADKLDANGYFRVGDVGYLDDDGFLFLTDRSTDLIISGGVNIYPAEIEAALLRHPAIQDAAVIGIPDEEFGEQVRAFVELKPQTHATPQELHAFAAAHLASYKRPKSIELIAELPRNTMGKILKRELRDPYWKHRERQV